MRLLLAVVCNVEKEISDEVGKQDLALEERSLETDRTDIDGGIFYSLLLFSIGSRSR